MPLECLGTMKINSCHKLRFSNSFIFATWCRRPLIFQKMNSVGPNSQSFKHKKFTPSGWKYKGVRVCGKTNSIEVYLSCG